MQVLAGIVGWADKREYAGKISYFFENGHHHQSLTNAAIDDLSASSMGKQAMQCHSRTPLPTNA